LTFRKGQAVVEFAIILPLFLLLLLGIFFLFIYCYNLIALQTMSRDIARAMSVNTSSLNDSYGDIKTAYADGKMSNLLVQGYYVWDPASTDDFPIPTLDSDNLTVTLKATSGGSYGGMINYIFGSGSDSFFTSMSVSTSMYKESST
jgi:Flp pilus assembly protein TadG